MSLQDVDNLVPPDTGTQDIESLIALDDDGLSRQPIFATSIGSGTNNNLFIAYAKDNKVKLRCSAVRGNNLTSEIDIMDVPGTVKLLKIGAKGDIAVVVALEETGSGKLRVRGSTGTIVATRDSNDDVISSFTYRACPEKEFHGRVSDILDLSIRINDDGTSDDYIFTKGEGGVNVAHLGHHIPAPSPPT